MRSVARAMAVAIALLCAHVWADGTVEERQTAVKLYRGSSIIAASDPKSSVYVPDFTPEACEVLLEQRWRAEADTRDDGKATYKCQVETRAIVAFHPAPTCPPLPAPEGRVVVCPSGTTGAYTQTLSYSAAPYPTCAVPGEWVPSSPPASICIPIDSDGDGVPDSTDQCPTVRSVTADGCPATPPGTATLSWTPPTQNVDGTALTNLAGFRIAYGTTQDLAQSIQVENPAATRYVIEGLAPGTWHFSVRAYKSDGVQSDQSAITSKAVP